MSIKAVMGSDPNPDEQDLKREMSEWEALCATSVVCAPGGCRAAVGVVNLRGRWWCAGARACACASAASSSSVKRLRHPVVVVDKSQQESRPWRNKLLELLDCPRSQNRERQDTEVNLFWGTCFLGVGELPSRVPRQACREGHEPRAGRGWNQRGRDMWPAIYAQGDGEVVSSGGRSRLKSRDGRRESGGQRRAGLDGKTRVVELVVARGELGKLGKLAKSHGSIPPAWAQLTGPPGPSAPRPKWLLSGVKVVPGLGKGTHGPGSGEEGVFWVAPTSATTEFSHAIVRKREGSGEKSRALGQHLRAL